MIRAGFLGGSCLWDLEGTQAATLLIDTLYKDPSPQAAWAPLIPGLLARLAIVQ